MIASDGWCTPCVIARVLLVRAEYYNSTTRALGNDDTVQFGPFRGKNVLDPKTNQPRFMQSIHGIAIGTKKLSFALPTKEVYRGLSGMMLPACFREKDKFGIAAGADYGFMSTTLDQGVALSYSKGETKNAASTVFAIQMDELNRGALVAFLSYYPTEREILFPPLARLEVRGEPSVRRFHGRECTWGLSPRTSYYTQTRPL